MATSATTSASRRASGPAEPRVGAGALGLVLAVAGVGALGAWPGSRGVPDPVALLVWIATWSLSAGWLCGSSRVALWPAAAVVPGAWMLLLGLVDAASDRDLVSPAWSGLAWTGLFAAGVGLARALVLPARTRRDGEPGRGGSPLGSASVGAHGGAGRACDARWSGAGLLFLLAGLANALPVAVALVVPAPAPATRVLLLDLAPATLLVECAGVDWLRHPVIYANAASADIDPSLRAAWSASLAGPVFFLVGCALAVLGELVARARRPPAGP